MNLRRIVVHGACCALIGSSLCAASASATTIGSVAPPGVTGATGGIFGQRSTHAGSAPYLVPVDGVITSFSVRTGSSASPLDSARLLGFEPVDTASATLVGDSGPKPILTNSAIESFATRVPVAAGDFLGIALTLAGGGDTAAYFNPVDGGQPSDDISVFNTQPNLGVPTPRDASVAGAHANIRAELEPDFDKDGYGDFTQDLCTTDAAVQTVCPLPPDSAAPIITQFKSLYKRFRWKPKGAVVSKRAHPGTTISLNLSEPAGVAFTVTKAFRGKLTNGQCKKAGRSNRKHRRCTKYVFVHGFTRNMATGVNAFPYSARYLDAQGKIGTLRKGPYRMTAVATDAAGNSGPPDTIAFKIRR